MSRREHERRANRSCARDRYDEDAAFRTDSRLRGKFWFVALRFWEQLLTAEQSRMDGAGGQGIHELEPSENSGKHERNPNWGWQHWWIGRASGRPCLKTIHPLIGWQMLRIIVFITSIQYIAYHSVSSPRDAGVVRSTRVRRFRRIGHYVKVFVRRIASPWHRRGRVALWRSLRPCADMASNLLGHH